MCSIGLEAVASCVCYRTEHAGYTKMESGKAYSAAV